MTTTTLTRDARLNVALFSLAEHQSVKPNFRFEKRTVGDKTLDVMVVEDLPVFRSGTFRDSMGFQHTWESIHMDQMVAHFDMLRTRGIFSDVPTRKGHPSFFGNPMDSLIGYHSGLRSETRTNPVDGKDYVYLLATFDVMDPEAIANISSGLWRNVSAEVGGFTSNDEAEFWPVYQGVAYVDISAVEGLKGFSSHNGVGKTFSLILDDEKEISVTAPTPPAQAPVAGAPAQASTTPNAVTPPTPAPQTPADLAYHGRAGFTFSIGGQQTNDFSAVQAHITTLEAAQSEAKTGNRKAFIKGLAEGTTPKILASQIPDIEGYALNLDDASWAAFEKAHAMMPALSSVSQHAAATQNGQPINPQGQTPVGGAPSGDAALDQVVGVFEMLKRSGMKGEALKATPSYSKLKTLKPDHPLLQDLPA